MFDTFQDKVVKKSSGRRLGHSIATLLSTCAQRALRALGGEVLWSDVRTVTRDKSSDVAPVRGRGALRFSPHTLWE